MVGLLSEFPKRHGWSTSLFTQRVSAAFNIHLSGLIKRASLFTFDGALGWMRTAPISVAAPKSAIMLPSFLPALRKGVSMTR